MEHNLNMLPRCCCHDFLLTFQLDPSTHISLAQTINVIQNYTSDFFFSPSIQNKLFLKDFQHRELTF